MCETWEHAGLSPPLLPENQASWTKTPVTNAARLLRLSEFFGSRHLAATCPAKNSRFNVLRAVRANVIDLSNNVVSFSRNLLLSGLLFSINVGLKMSDVVGFDRLCSQVARYR